MPLTLMVALRLFHLDDYDDDEDEQPNLNAISIALFCLTCFLTIPLDIVLAPFCLIYAGIRMRGGCDRETDNMYMFCLQGCPPK